MHTHTQKHRNTHTCTPTHTLSLSLFAIFLPFFLLQLNYTRTHTSHTHTHTHTLHHTHTHTHITHTHHTPSHPASQSRFEKDKVFAEFREEEGDLTAQRLVTHNIKKEPKIGIHEMVLTFSPTDISKREFWVFAEK